MNGYRELTYDELGLDAEEKTAIKRGFKWRDDGVTVYRSKGLTAGFYLCAIIAVLCYLYLFVVHIL